MEGYGSTIELQAQNLLKEYKISRYFAQVKPYGRPLKRRKRVKEEGLVVKANRVLNGILVILLLIVFRLWHLAVIEHEAKEQASLKPQRRILIEKADRGPIVDRFGVPLAQNKIEYNVTLSYGEIREIPRTTWEIKEGKKVKCFKRKEYIKKLANYLAKELNLDPTRIEDEIHARAPIFGSVPFTIKEGIEEESYCRIKMNEHYWPGIHATIGSKRNYPLGREACDVIGYIGAINRAEFEKLTYEGKELRNFLSRLEEGEEASMPGGFFSVEAVKKRLEEIERKAYRITDYVGKLGIEKEFEEVLRGDLGTKSYLCDVKGNFLQELNSKEKEGGKKITLSLSHELQSYAEELLTNYEQSHIGGEKYRDSFPPYQPWIKGAAAVVLDPNTGEVLALASTPRFDPNDFILKNSECKRWVEGEALISEIWDQRSSLKRERYNTKEKTFFDQSLKMTWDVYLDMILPRKNGVRAALEKISTVEQAQAIQQKVASLLALFNGELPVKVFDYLYGGNRVNLNDKKRLNPLFEKQRLPIETLKQELAPFFEPLVTTDEKLLLVDLCQVAINTSGVTSQLMEVIGKKSLSQHRHNEIAFCKFQEVVKKMVKEAFLEVDFKNWRESEFSHYLEERRKKEKYARPYLEYLDKAEKELFESFWEKKKWELLLLTLHSDKPLKRWQEVLEEGQCEKAEWLEDYLHLKELGKTLAPDLFLAYLQTFRKFSDLNRPLLGMYRGFRGTLGKQTEKDLASAFYPKCGFGLGRSYAYSQAMTVGSIFKLVPGYEALKQRYLKHQEARDLNPLTIIDDRRQNGDDWIVGETLEGKAISRSYKGGKLPRSDHSGIGKVDIVGALAASSNPYFAILSGDVLGDPEDLGQASRLFSYGTKTGIQLPNEFAGKIPIDCAYNRTGLYSFAIGQHSLVGTPLQSAVMLAALANGGKVLKPKILKDDKPEVRWSIFLPKEVRHLLLKGLKEVIWSEKGTARDLKNQFSTECLKGIIGKTSTAEIIEEVNVCPKSGKVKLVHVAFGAMSFEDEAFEKPELIVVVYLRFGSWGREAAPLAVKIIDKYRSIKKAKGP